MKILQSNADNRHLEVHTGFRQAVLQLAEIPKAVCWGYIKFRNIDESFL